MSKTKEQLEKELKEAQERLARLEASEARLQDIVMNTADWIWEVDDQGRYTYCSDGVTRTLGYSAEEVLGKVPFDFMPPEETARVGKIFGDAAEKKSPVVNLENWNLTKDGRRVCLLTNGVPILDRDGNLCGYRGADRDITEQKRAQEFIFRLKSLVDNTNDFVGLSDMNGNVLYTNPKGLQMVGRSASDPLVSSVTAFYSPEWIPRLYEYVAIAAEKGLWAGDLEMLHADGSPVPVSGVLILIRNDEGEPIGFGAVYRDISERKRVEEELLYINKAVESVSDAIGIVDVTGKSIYLNRAFVEMFEYTPEELDAIGGPAVLYVEESMGDEARAFALKGSPWSSELEMRSRSGRVMFVAVRTDAIKDETGKIIGLIGVHTDISERKRAELERERMQQQVIDAQRRAIQELSTPVIPIMERIIVMPLIGSIDTLRAKDIMRVLLSGISEHRARVVILDITGVPIVDSGVANHLNKTIQAARLKGARTIVTGISDAVAETVVDLGIDWSGVETLRDLQTGLIVALDSMGIQLQGKK